MWATERYYEILGTRFHVRSSDQHIGDAVDQLLHRFRREPCGVPGRRRYALVQAKSDGASHALYRDCNPKYRHQSWSFIVGALLTELNLEALGEVKHFAAHAGVIAAEGKVIAFPAESGDGKSTLTAACLAAGFDYVSDEALCIEYGTGEVVAYPKPLGLSRWSREALDLPSPRVQLQAPQDEAALLPEELGARVATGTLRLAHVVHLVRTEGEARLEPLPGSETMATLLRMSFNHYKRPQDAFAMAADLAQSSRGWRLELSDPTKAARLLAERLGAELQPQETGSR